MCAPILALFEEVVADHNYVCGAYFAVAVHVCEGIVVGVSRKAEQRVSYQDDVGRSDFVVVAHVSAKSNLHLTFDEFVLAAAETGGVGFQGVVRADGETCEVPVERHCCGVTWK